MAELTEHLEIRDLLARIAQLSDHGDLDEYLDCYTDDAVWEMPANATVGLPASRRQGRDVIAEGVRERRAIGLQGPGSNTQHVVTTTSLRVDGDTATGHSYFQYWAETATAPVLKTMGQYHDRFRRTSTGWRLSHRTIEMG